MALLFRRRVMLSYVVIRCVSVSTIAPLGKDLWGSKGRGFFRSLLWLTWSTNDGVSPRRKLFKKTGQKRESQKHNETETMCSSMQQQRWSNRFDNILRSSMHAVNLLLCFLCLESVRDKQNPIKTSGINAINRIAPQPASTIETHLSAFHTELDRASHNPPIRTLQYRTIKDLCPS